MSDKCRGRSNTVYLIVMRQLNTDGCWRDPQEDYLIVCCRHPFLSRLLLQYSGHDRHTKWRMLRHTYHRSTIQEAQLMLLKCPSSLPGFQTKPCARSWVRTPILSYFVQKLRHRTENTRLTCRIFSHYLVTIFKLI